MWVKINGISMSPLLPDGSLARLVLCNTNDLQSGDIIIFKRSEAESRCTSGESDGFVAHRLINKVIHNNNRYLRTKGDISFGYDSLTNPKYLIGKVVTFRRWGILIPINNTAGRLVGLGISYISPFLFRLWTKIKHISQQCQI